MDGLGWGAAGDHPAVAPFLSSSRATWPITAGLPPPPSPASARCAPAARRASTGCSVTRSWCPARTSCSTRCAGTGGSILASGRHCHDLRASRRAGIAAVHVAQGSFRGTGLTVATMLAATFARRQHGARSLRAPPRSRDGVRRDRVPGDLDNTDRPCSGRLDSWYNELADVTSWPRQLFSAPPFRPAWMSRPTTAWWTSAGGPDRLDEIAELRIGVAVLGGEARARHVYAEPGAAGKSWPPGVRSWPTGPGCSRDQAIRRAGRVRWTRAWPTGSATSPRRSGPAIVAAETEPRGPRVGMHGSHLSRRARSRAKLQRR